MIKKIAFLLCATVTLSACGTTAGGLRPAPVALKQQKVSAQSHTYTLDEMGIGKQQLRHLAKAGITNNADLLEAARTDYGREKLVANTGIAPDQLLELVNLVDLLRVGGIGPGQSRLLVESGVRTVKDLAQRNPVALHSAIAELNDSERLLERTPGLETVTKWVEQAKLLDRVITY